MNYLQVPRTVFQHGKTVLLTVHRRLTSMSPGSKQVLHNEEEKEFYIQLGDGKAFIKYDKLNGDIDLLHTEVPKKFAGQGLGSALAQGTFNLIKEKNVHMKLTCEFLQSYYKKHQCKELKDLLVPEQKNSL